MVHLAFDYHPDHDFIAAQIEADLAAESTGAVVIAGPWSANPTAYSTDTR